MDNRRTPYFYRESDLPHREVARLLPRQADEVERACCKLGRKA